MVSTGIFKEDELLDMMKDIYGWLKEIWFGAGCDEVSLR